MKRWMKRFLATALLLAVFALGSVWFLLHTETGAAWVIDVAKDRLPGNLAFARLEGDFASGLVISELDFEQDGLSAQSQRLALSITPQWIPLTVNIHFLELENLKVGLPEPAGGTETGGIPESLALPVPIELQRFALDALTVLDADEQVLFQAAQLKAEASFSDKAEIHSLELESEFGPVIAGGFLSLVQPFMADATLSAELDVSLSGQAEPLSVHLDGQLAGQKGAYELLVDANAGLGRFGLDLDGTVDFQQASLHGEANWHDFSWPLESEHPDILSPAGQVALSGTFDNWKVAGKAVLDAPGFADGTLEFDSSGDQEHVEATIRQGQLLGGSLSGHVNYNWVQDGVFDLQLETENLSTGPLYPEVPAVVSANFSARGQLEPLSVSMDVPQLHAAVFDREVTASGKVDYGPGELRFDGFELRAEDSSVVIDGSLNNSAGLDFAADLREIASFFPGASGTLTASGNVRMTAGQARLKLDAEGKALAWEDVFIPSLAISDLPSAGAEALAALKVDLLNPEYAGTALDSAMLELDLGETRQTAALTAVAGDYSLGLGMAGSVVNPGLAMADWEWKGSLVNLALAHDDDRVLELETPASLLFAASQARVGSSCLVMKAGPRACLEGGWQEAAGLQANMKLDQAPLELLNLLANTDFAYTQRFDGEARVSALSGSPPDVSARFNITAGNIHFADDDEPIIETGDGVIALEVSRGSVTSVLLDLPLPGQGEIGLDFQLEDLKKGLQSALSGRVLVDLEDLDILTVALPWFDQLGGRLDVDLGLSGTTGSPRIEGRVDLVDGALMHSASGLRISEVQLAGRLEGNRETRLVGSFRAVEGRGDLEALVNLYDVVSPAVTLNVSGEALRLFDTKDLQLLVEPDFQVAWEPRGIGLEGRINIPEALLAPTMIPVPPVTESADLQIVAGEVPGEEDDETESRLAIYGSLDVSLGDQVKLDVSVAKLDVTGSTRFTWSGDPLPMANGSLSLDGEILAFGQLLEIERGTIGFPDVLADNPHLNIQAERRIYGNSEVRRAGLLVAGTLRRPIIEPYTEPMTTRERAQTLLITGSDFNMERGVGALNVGTYIAPRLFVSYGIGVFEDGNVFGIRYDLSENWGVKASSGERETGVDISYTIDN